MLKERFGARLEQILAASWQRILVLYALPLVFLTLAVGFHTLLSFLPEELNYTLALLITLALYAAAESKTLSVYKRKRYPYFYPGFYLYNLAIVLIALLAINQPLWLLLFPLVQYLKFNEITNPLELIKQIKKSPLVFVKDLLLYAAQPLLDLIPPFSAVLHPMIVVR